MSWSKIFVKGRKAWDIFRFRLPYIWCGSLKLLNGWEVVSFSNDMKREREREMIFSRIESDHCSHPPKKRTSDFPQVITTRNTVMENPPLKFMDFVVFQGGRYPTGHMAYGCVLKGIRVCWQFISSTTGSWTLYLYLVKMKLRANWAVSQVWHDAFEELHLHSWRNQAFNHLLDIYIYILYETPSAKQNDGGINV